MKNYTIRMEQPCDFKAIENLTREAFWNVYRPGCTEHYVLHCYRENSDFIPELSLVLEVDGEIVGHVMYAWSHIDADDGRKIKMMTFGPISIRPDFKRKGYGKILLDHSWNSRKRWEPAACSSWATSISTARAVLYPHSPRESATPTTRKPPTSCARNWTTVSWTESPVRITTQKITLSQIRIPKHSSDSTRNFRLKKNSNCPGNCSR